MNVIITGATGFIGTALCKEMINNGHSVTAIVRPNSQKIGKLDNKVSIVELALDELDKLGGDYDLFYHLAWNGSSGADRNDFDIQNSNIKYTAEAIKAAKRCRCKKFIGAGSQAEYGVVHGICKEDSTVPNPFMMYGAAKLSSYHIGKVLADQLGISFVWPRIYSVYGVGENDGTLISYLIKTLKYGETAELSSCENMWDFMYITDCVRALRMLGESEKADGIYNVSAGKSRLLKEFVKEIKDIIDSDGKVNFGIKKVDKKRTFWLEPDVSRLRSIGFRCKIRFNKGIQHKILNKCEENENE